MRAVSKLETGFRSPESSESQEVGDGLAHVPILPVGREASLQRPACHHRHAFERGPPFEVGHLEPAVCEERALEDLGATWCGRQRREFALCELLRVPLAESKCAISLRIESGRREKAIRRRSGKERAKKMNRTHRGTPNPKKLQRAAECPAADGRFLGTRGLVPRLRTTMCPVDRSVIHRPPGRHAVSLRCAARVFVAVDPEVGARPGATTLAEASRGAPRRRHPSAPKPIERGR